MKTYISDIIPKIQRFSKRLDSLTMLTNQHWVVVDEITNNKTVYIFRENNELLISQNGKIEKAKWEYLGNNSLLIDKKDESYLFKHGFFDENILALKVDGKEEYAFLVNENRYNGDLDSSDQVIEFLIQKYIEPQLRDNFINNTGVELKELRRIELKRSEVAVFVSYKTNKGMIEIEQNNLFSRPKPGKKAIINGEPASTGKYRFGFMWYVHIEYGRVTKITLL